MTNENVINSEAKIRSLIESMRASSPTRSNPSINNTHNRSINSCWAAQYPSALKMFKKITEASRGKQIVMFLDYDGTLSPIVDDPELAYMTNQMRDTVKSLAKLFPTAIVTGRCLDKVYDFVKLAELYYAGSHGMDIKGPSKVSNRLKRVYPKGLLFQPKLANEFLPIIQEVFKLLVEKTKSIPGASVENNKFCVSVHYRRVDEKRWGEVFEQVKAVLSDFPRLKLTQGRMVFEIRPTIKWDKGKALEYLMKSLGFANCRNVFPVYIGDDRTDEDAFKILKERKQGFGILVSKIPKETNASYTLQEPNEVMNFLKKLVVWKQQSSGRNSLM